MVKQPTVQNAVLENDALFLESCYVAVSIEYSKKELNKKYKTGLCQLEMVFCIVWCVKSDDSCTCMVTLVW